MMVGELLNVQPGELKFPFELKKQISTSLTLENVTSEHVAFKVKTTSPKKYCVRPNTGVIPPQSSMEVVVTMQAQKEVPPDLQCKDKFLVQGVLMPGASAAAEVVPDVFNKENGREVFEAKLRVVYLAPAQPPSPIIESPEEGYTESESLPVSTSFTASEQLSKEAADLKSKLEEARKALSIMAEEKTSALREIKKLKASLNDVRSGFDQKISAAVGASHAVLNSHHKEGATAAVQKVQGFSSLAVLLVALLAFLLGLFFSRS